MELLAAVLGDSVHCVFKVYLIDNLGAMKTGISVSTVRSLPVMFSHKCMCGNNGKYLNSGSHEDISGHDAVMNKRKYVDREVHYAFVECVSS